MPRGQMKPAVIRTGILPGSGRPPGPAPRPEVAREAILACVQAFVRAWFQGDTAAMLRCLHPDQGHRLVAIDGRGEPVGDPLRGALGVQARFGPLTAPEQRAREVRILDVRSQSASAVAMMGEWVLQVHLARSGRAWSIVNVLWEMA